MVEGVHQGWNQGKSDTGIGRCTPPPLPSENEKLDLRSEWALGLADVSPLLLTSTPPPPIKNWI